MTSKTLKIAVASLLIAIGYVLPFITMNIPSIGNMLLPMHIPAMLAGLFLGYKYGLLVGFILPITRSFIFGLPEFYPRALIMAFELATYGLMCGLLFKTILNMTKNKVILAVIITLLIAMLTGRLVWGTLRYITSYLLGIDFTFELFLIGGFISAWPGIIVQLVLIPSIMIILVKSKIGKKLLNN